MSLFEELKRRNVFRVGIAYVLISWLLLQGADFAFDLVGAPNWVIQSLSIVVVLGLPIALFFAWAYELTPEGIKREREVDRSQSITPNTGKKLNSAILVLMTLAIAYLLIDKLFISAPEHETAGIAITSEPVTSATEEQAAEPEVSRQSIAVLPFLALSSGPDDEFFADGLTEEILNSLAQLPELLVTARTSAFHFKGKNLTATEIAASLGVAHIVEGSVRRSGDRLRVTAQLIRANDGFHLWSENYDETTKDTIAVQEDIAEKIAGALNVILDDEDRKSMHQAGIRDVEAFINYQKARDQYSKAHGSEDILRDLRKANVYLDAAIERVPEFSLAYLFHSDLYTHILLENSAGVRNEDISDQDVADAMDNALSDFRSAARFANTPEQRANVDLDLALLSGNWQDMYQRIERLLQEDSCSAPIWIAALAAWTEDTNRLANRLKAFQACDPLGPTGLFNLAGAAVWTGDPELALKTSLEGLALQEHDYIAAWNVRALIMNDRLDEAETALNLNIRQPYERDQQKVIVAAARGDTEAARQGATEWQQVHGPSDYVGLLFAAWLGDREAANRYAAAMDSRPMGYLNLLVAAYWCTCGAPFDLDATPDFAARLRGSGMPWPPATPTKLPLKDW